MLSWVNHQTDSASGKVGNNNEITKQKPSVQLYITIYSRLAASNMKDESKGRNNSILQTYITNEKKKKKHKSLY